MKTATIEQHDGYFAVHTPYDRRVVEAVKSLPSADRQWSKIDRAWLVHGQHLSAVSRKLQGLGFTVRARGGPALTEKLVFMQVIYLGAAGPVSPGTYQARGLIKEVGAGGRNLLEGVSWGGVFPRSVLKAWFMPNATGGTGDVLTANYFDLFGVKDTATEAEIKSAYRKMLFQWHPDTCREADAGLVTKRVVAAYEVLKDPITRGRYGVGLALESGLSKRQKQGDTYKGVQVWKPPLRCGSVCCKAVGSWAVSWHVNQILSWQPIVDGQRQLVTSWAAGSSEPHLEWVTP